jgi:Holliday junction resolvase RusA-like endonuclease
MTTLIKALEYRLAVPGKPESFRSRKSKDFREKIKKYAELIIHEPIIKGVEVYVDYFHRRNRKMDMDNISKNVLDALNGIAYKDDRQVKNQNSRAHDIRNIITITDLPLDAVKPLKEWDEYIFIRIREIN